MSQTQSNHWLTTSFLYHDRRAAFTLRHRFLKTVSYDTASQFFVGAQTLVSLLQTTQIKQDVSCIVAIEPESLHQHKSVSKTSPGGV